MSKRPIKKTLKTPGAGSGRRMAKKEPASKLTSAIWETPEGEVFTRRQLSNKLARANYKLKQAEQYMSAKGYEKLQKDFAGVVNTAYRSAGRVVAGAAAPLPSRFVNQKTFTLKGIEDPVALRALNDAADRILSWERMTKTGYDILRANAVVSQMQKFNISEEDAEMLVDLYDSDDWETFHDSVSLVSGQVMDDFMDAFAKGDIDVQSFGDIIRKMVQQHKDAVEDKEGLTFDPFTDPIDWIYAELHGQTYTPPKDGFYI